MNDYEVVKYTESRHITHTRQALEDFVNSANSKKTHTFAILVNDSDIHIGNIKLDNINWYHRCGDIGLIIGRKEYYGKGIATESINLVTKYAFEQLGLNRIECGIYSLNIGSVRAFQKAGYEIYATVPRSSMFEGDFIDTYLLHKYYDM